MKGCAGGVDIVDQEDALACNERGIIDFKGSAKIGETFFS